MAQLDERLEARMNHGIELLRAHRSPPVGSQARVLAALEAQLGGPPDGGSDGAGPLGGGSVAYAAKLVGATLALTAAGLLTLRAGALLVHAIAGDDGRAPVAASSPQPVARESEPTIASEPEPTIDADPEPMIHAQPDPKRVDDQPEQARPPASPTQRGVDRPDLAAELALIEAARSAGGPAQAIASLKAHAREFPRGTLADEREVLWVIASCELGELDDAKVRAHEFSTRRPNSPLVDRMLGACPALASTITKTNASGHGPG